MKIIRAKQLYVGPRDATGRRTWEIAIGDARERIREIPDESVDIAVCSPAYWKMRNYENHPDQMGSEPTLAGWVEAHVVFFREVRRVLKAHGSLWVNVGDRFAQGGRGSDNQDTRFTRARRHSRSGQHKTPNFAAKQLLMMPERLAIAMQEDGWFVRSRIIWAKTSFLPEHFDRPSKSHEHVWFFTKNARYFYDQDAVRTDHVEKTQGFRRPREGDESSLQTAHHEKVFGRHWVQRERTVDPRGANMRDVWFMGRSQDSTKEKHFAMFPDDLPANCIKAGSSERGVCAKCGKPFVRIMKKGKPDRARQIAAGGDENGEYHGESKKHAAADPAPSNNGAKTIQNPSDTKRNILASMLERETIGWRPSCHRRDCSRCGGSGKLTVPALVEVIEGEPFVRVAGRVDTCPSCKGLGVWWETCAEAHERGVLERFRADEGRNPARDIYYCKSADCGHDLNDHSLTGDTCSRCNCARMRLVSEEAQTIPATVLDTFSGLATTLKMARRLGRYARGIELVPKYARRSARRLERDQAIRDHGDVKPKTETEEKAMRAQLKLGEWG